MLSEGKLTTYLAVGMITLGFLLMFLAWHYSANLDYVQGQIPYLLSATAPGLGFVMTGLALAVVQELRRNTNKIVEHLHRETSATVAEGPMTTPVALPDDGSHVLATATTFHAPDCEVITGRTDVTPLGHDDAVARNLHPCRVCEPRRDHSAA